MGEKGRGSGGVGAGKWELVGRMVSVEGVEGGRGVPDESASGVGVVLLAGVVAVVKRRRGEEVVVEEVG